MLEIARATYLEEVLFGKKDSTLRLEISSLIEASTRHSVEALLDLVELRMQQRLFMCGLSITAVDFVVFAHLAAHFSKLDDASKMALPNTFRWIDHIQNLPGMRE